MFSLSDLKSYVEANPKLVKMRESTRYPGLYVAKYDRSVFFKKLWNEYLEYCRGLVVDKDFNIVSLPFTKIYNYGVEANAPVVPDETMVQAYRKVNGFMASITWHDGDILVSTTGSLDSPYVDMVYDMIGDNLEAYRMTCRNRSQFTFMFECVHPEDPHIVLEKEGMYLLGMRWKELGSQVYFPSDAHLLFPGSHRVERYNVTMLELKLMAEVAKHEGYVFYSTVNGEYVSSKLKSPYYLVSKLFARKGNMDSLLTEEGKSLLDEEFHSLHDKISADREFFSALDEQARLSYIRSYFMSL